MPIAHAYTLHILVDALIENDANKRRKNNRKLPLNFRLRLFLEWWCCCGGNRQSQTTAGKNMRQNSAPDSLNRLRSNLCTISKWILVWMNAACNLVSHSSSCAQLVAVVSAHHAKMQNGEERLYFLGIWICISKISLDKSTAKSGDNNANRTVDKWKFSIPQVTHAEMWDFHSNWKTQQRKIRKKSNFSFLYRFVRS